MSNWRAENEIPPPQDFLEALMGEEDDDEDVCGMKEEPESDFEEQEDCLKVYLEEEELDEMGSSSAPRPPTSHRWPPPVPLVPSMADGEADQRSRSPLRQERTVLPPSPEAAGGRRSRSPTGMEHERVSSPTSPGMNVVVLYDHNNDGELYQVGHPVLPEGFMVPLNSKEVLLEESRPDGMQEDEFWEPDAHAVYARDDRMDAVGRHFMDDSVRKESDRMDDSVRDEGGRRGSVRGRARGGRRGRALRVRYTGSARRAADRRIQWKPGHPLHEIWLHDEDVPIEFRQMVRDLVRRREARAKETRERSMSKGRPERNRETVGEDSESENDDEFLDAIAERDLLEGESKPFDWQPMTTYQGTEETFTPERTGSVGSYSTAYDAFRSYWDDSILRLIADESNKYATTISSPSFQRDWYPTNSHEILCLFAFWMMVGIIRMPTIESCFSVDPLLKTEIFRRIFSRSRYLNLCRALHFSANSTSNDPASSDRLHRLRPILDHLNAKFQANYIPSQNISLAESLTLWKGRLDKQYIRTKAARFGIQSFELCESTTGYLWSFIVYTGKQTNPDLPHNPLMRKSTAVVMKLISPLLNKGYRLFMDNWYNSPLLARYLKRNGTDCVGTLRPNLSDVPELVARAPLKQGQLIARHSGDVCVLAWQDKKRVTMLSTCHGSEIALATVPSKEPPAARPLLFKPQVVLDYNKYIGGVDLKDQMLEPYLIERKKCAIWYIKLFKRLLNCSILNSRILLQSSSGHVKHHLSFRLHLVDTILNNHLAHIPRPRPSRPSVRTDGPVRTGPHVGHWPIHNKQTANDLAQNRQTRLRCVVCAREGRKFSKTIYRCEACNKPLCIYNCFKAYHL